MKRLKKFLLFIIAIQSMVLIQLLTIKECHLEEEVKKISFNFWDSTPKVTPQEYKFFNQLYASANETPKREAIKFFTLGQGYVQYSITHDVEKTAKKLLGRPYVWGATGPNKFDCSGFTQKVFRKAGIKIPRNSRAQAKVGQYITFNQLKCGDMVFFATNKKNAKRVTHVGIYLEEGKFIHASSGGKRVMISSFEKNPYYKQRFVLGRRIIKGYLTQRITKSLTSNHT